MLTLMESTDEVPLLSHSTFGFERFIFFSDAVFAIAITLLVLDLHVPAGAPLAMGPLIPRFICFGLSFSVIGRYWYAHHQLFEKPQAYDAGLLATNLAFLASIVFLPFPTSAVILERPDPGPVIFYTLSVAMVGVLMMALTVVATRPALRPWTTQGRRARVLLNTAEAPLVFIFCAGLALYDSHLALWAILILIPLGWAFAPLGRWLEAAIDRPKPVAPPQ
jgi:uncharacterized membrane protein